MSSCDDDLDIADCSTNPMLPKRALLVTVRYEAFGTTRINCQHQAVSSLELSSMVNDSGLPINASDGQQAKDAD